MTNQSRIILALLQLPSIGRKTIRRYLLPSAGTQFDESDIISLLTVGKAKTSRIKDVAEEDVSNAINAANHILDLCEQLEIKTVSILDSDYPDRLKYIDDPPVLLYYRGNINAVIEHRTLAIIGTREPTQYGYRIAVRMGEMMAEAGITTVSGLAIGCDTGGHTGTINKNGTTVGILANGLDTVYPKENQKIANEILDLAGCLISEYPPKAEVQRGFFVDRDRLQAALSDAVFVVETDIKGGTMHTVDFARKYKRQVYCFNHPEKYLIEPKTRGNQKLIRDGYGIGISNKNDIIDMINYIQNTQIHTTVTEQLSLLNEGDQYGETIPCIYSV